jgi:WD40 repeat protein
MLEVRSSAAGVAHVLSMKYIFGINSGCGHDLELLDSKSIVYVAGANIVKYNLDEKSQEYSQATFSKSSPTITDICLNSSRDFLAIAKKGTRAQIQLLNAKTLKPHEKSSTKMNEEENKLMQDFYHLAFSPTDNKIAALSNAADPVLSYWAQEAQGNGIKAIGYMQLKCPVEKVSVHPNRSDTICCVGPETFKLIRYYPDKGPDESLKFHVASVPSKKEIPSDFRCHCWFVSPTLTCIILCASRNIYILKDDNADILFTLENNDPKNYLDINCIAPVKDGFIVGGEGLKIQKYRKKENEESFTPLPASRINQNIANSDYAISDGRGSNIMAIRIDSEEEKLICLTDVRSIYSASLKYDTASALKVDSDGSVFSPTFTLACDPGHSDKINFMDTCVRKPLIATCSQDRTVKVWDYEKKELVYNMSFSEECFALAFHPSGYQLVVSMADKIIFTKLYLKSREQQQDGYRSLAVKACKFMKFNHGGDLLAAASGETPPEITIYRFYENSSSPILQLKGHTGIIRCLEWAPDDLSLYSCGAHGMIYRWNIKDGERRDILSKKSTTVNDMCLTLDNTLNPNQTSPVYTILLAVDAKESLREITIGGNQENIVSTESTDPIFGCVVKSVEKKMTFAGVRDPQRDGSIYFYRHPLTSKETSSKTAHNYLGVARILLTPKDKYLISGGYDGTIIIFEIDDKDARAGAGLMTEFKDYCPNIVATESELKDLESETGMLYAQLGNDTVPGGHSTDMPGTSANESVKSQNEFTKLKNDYSKKADELLQKLATLKEQREKEIETEKATHKNLLKELDVYSTGNLGEKQDRIKDLETNMRSNENRFKDKISMLEAEHQRQMKELQENFQMRLEKEREDRNTLEKDIADINDSNAREQETIEKVASEDASKVEKKYADDQQNFKGKQIKLKNDIQSYQKKISKAKAKATSLQEQIGEKNETLRKDKQRDDELKKQILVLEEKLKEKNAMITKSEKRIYEQKKRTGELEKFKYVLDFKIKELKKDMLPRENEIQRLKADTTKEDQHLKGLNNSSNSLGEIVKKLQEEQQGLINKINAQKAELVAQNNKIKKLKNALSESIKHIQNYPKLVEQLRSIKTVPKQHNEIDKEIKEEYKNQIEYLSMSSKKLKKNLEKDAEMHKQDNMRIMKHNVDLIRYIGKMRNKIKSTSQSSKPDHFAKIGGIKKEQEGIENNINKQLLNKEINLEKEQRLREDLMQICVSKPGYERELEEKFQEWIETRTK